MELWIRSQNKGTLMKVEILGQTDGIIKAYFPNGNVELGTYKNAERALEVLDDIEEVINHLDDPKLNVSIFVYQMPEE